MLDPALVALHFNVFEATNQLLTAMNPFGPSALHYPVILGQDFVIT